MSTSVDSEEIKPRPHAVCVPFPAQGHISPMLKLAKLLHHRGFHITFVNTEFNHRRLLKSRGSTFVESVSSFRFETIPDGLPPSDPDATQDLVSLVQCLPEKCEALFRELISNLHAAASETGRDVPPVTCFVTDAGMQSALALAEELGIPNVFLWTASACSLLGYLHFGHLIDKGITPLKDESYLTNGYLDTVVDWIPGMSGIRLKDLPNQIRTTDPNDVMLNATIKFSQKLVEGSAIIMNTFDALECEVLDALSSLLPPIYTVGPLNLRLDQIQEGKNNALDIIGSNLWKEETECLEWLDSKKPNSVVYVNFGSITVMTPQQLTEFAWGLANSNQSFVWIIRPDLVVGESATLPREFVTETKERGLLASWCPQEQVLKHPAVGGFLTHNGWNSTIESISYGVPMVCWPFFADQQTNCWYCCTKWGVGMELDSNVKRDEVERLVRELIEGEKGKELKIKAIEWKNLTEEATKAGSSAMNLDKLINQMLISPFKSS